MNDLPFMVHAWTILFIFVCELILFHGVFYLIRDKPSIKGIWAIVQYVVYGLAMLGLLGAVSNARQFLAQSLFDYGKPHYEFEFQSLRKAVERFSAPGGPVCITLTKAASGGGPGELKALQTEYDQTCAWFAGLAKGLPKEVPEDFSAIDWNGLPGEPRVTDARLKSIVEYFKQIAGDYDAAAMRRRGLAAGAKRKWWDEAAILVLPLSLSLALALQVTKVTYDTWWKKAESGESSGAVSEVPQPTAPPAAKTPVAKPAEKLVTPNVPSAEKTVAPDVNAAKQTSVPIEKPPGSGGADR